MDSEISKIRKKKYILDDETSNQSTETKENSLEAPPDKYFIATLFFFFVGIVRILPLTFFLNPNDFWMYKLRNPEYVDYDLNNKTELQTLFVSANQIVTSVSSLISIILAGTFLYRFKMRDTFLILLGSMTTVFLIFNLLVKVNTDSWQITFFGISMCLLGINALFIPFLNITIMVYLSRFPYFYMKLNLYGSSMGGLLGSAVQLICLSLGDDTIYVATIYFTIGTLIISMAFLLSFLIRYSPVIQHYEAESQNDEGKTHSLKEVWEASKEIWPLLLIMFIITFGMSLAHPNISNLIVSEGYTGNKENLWYDKYFPVAAVYFLFDFFQLVGQIFVFPMITKKNYVWFIIITVTRGIVMAPLFIFCNAQPRNLPVWFPHDYQFMIIMIVYSLTFSILLNTILVSVPNLCEDKTETGLLVLTGSYFAAATLIGPANPFFVKLLEIGK